jgi:hypothetical protein
VFDAAGEERSSAEARAVAECTGLGLGHKTRTDERGYFVGESLAPIPGNAWRRWRLGRWSAAIATGDPSQESIEGRHPTPPRTACTFGAGDEIVKDPVRQRQRQLRTRRQVDADVICGVGCARASQPLGPNGTTGLL